MKRPMWAEAPDTTAPKAPAINAVPFLFASNVHSRVMRVCRQFAKEALE